MLILEVASNGSFCLVFLLFSVIHICKLSCARNERNISQILQWNIKYFYSVSGIFSVSLWLILLLWYIFISMGKHVIRKHKLVNVVNQSVCH